MPNIFPAFARCICRLCFPFHIFCATSELPWFGSANLLLHLQKLAFPLLSAASLTSPSLIFHLLSNLLALTCCIFHLLWHENMAPISWKGSMERERQLIWPEWEAKHFFLSLGTPAAQETLDTWLS